MHTSQLLTTAYGSQTYTRIPCGDICCITTSQLHNVLQRKHGSLSFPGDGNDYVHPWTCVSGQGVQKQGSHKDVEDGNSSYS